MDIHYFCRFVKKSTLNIFKNTNNFIVDFQLKTMNILTFNKKMLNFLYTNNLRYRVYLQELFLFIEPCILV